MTILGVENLSVSYGAVRAVEGVSLDIEDGEAVAILGANGAGKTSLLFAVVGVHRPMAGSVRVDGVEVTRTGPEEKLRRGVCLVPERRQVFDSLSVEDNLRLGAYVRKRLPRGQVTGEIERVYELFPVLGKRRTQSAGTLSGGEQQMLALGRGLMGSPRLLMVDEPSLGLAPTMVSVVMEALVRLSSEGMAILLVEQNARMAMAIAQRVLVLERGRVVMSGSVTEVRSSERLRQAYLGV
ncbi:MAG: ABC transporter ATP-binding protein [Candidatus Dormibacteria bacterium]